MVIIETKVYFIRRSNNATRNLRFIENFTIVGVGPVNLEKFELFSTMPYVQDRSQSVILEIACVLPLAFSLYITAITFGDAATTKL